MTTGPFDRTLLRRRLARKREPGDGAHFLLERMAEEIAARLEFVRRDFPLALDLGVAAPYLGRRLCEPPCAQKVGRLISLIEAVPPARAAHRPALVGDLEALAIAPQSLDLIVSAGSLAFVNDLPGVLIQSRLALKADGLFLAAIIGGDSLGELRAAIYEAEEALFGGVTPRIHPMIDVRSLGGLLQRAGFALPVVDSDRVTVTYSSPLKLLSDLKAMGAGNILRERSRRPTSRALWLRTAEIYEKRFGVDGGGVRATFEILNMTAWAPHPAQPKPLARGSARMRLADALPGSEAGIDRGEDA